MPMESDCWGSGEVLVMVPTSLASAVRAVPAGGGSLGWEAERDAAAVYLAAGADAFDDFLAGVAAFGVADVGVFQAGFVGNLFVAEVVAEPGDGLFEAKGVEGDVADGAAADGSRFFCEKIPERLDVFAVDADVGGRVRCRKNFRVMVQAIELRFVSIELNSGIASRSIPAARSLSSCGGFWSLQGECVRSDRFRR